MSLEAYTRQDGLVSYCYKFRYRGKTYRGHIGIVSKATAKRIELQAHVRVSEGRYIHSEEIESPTFNAFAPDFIEHYRKIANERSARDYHARLLNHILPYLGNIRLADASTACLEKYSLQRNQEGVSPFTLNGEISVIAAMLQYAIDIGILPEGSRAQLPWGPRPERTIRVLSITEEERLISAATAHLKPFIRFALQTGLTRNELVRLTWTEVDLSRREIVVVNGRHKKGVGRIVPLTTTALAILAEVQERPPSGHIKSRDRVFGYHSVSSPFDRTADIAGLTGVNCQTLRDTFAVRCLERGIHIRMLQRWLGHASLVHTIRYLSESSGDEHESIEKLVD